MPCTVPFEDAPEAQKAPICPEDPTGNLELSVGKVTFIDAPNKPSVTVELAQDSVAQGRGLMYRTSMPANSGMLFSWADEQLRTFWMHNTCIPLDMLFMTEQGFVS